MMKAKRLWDKGSGVDQGVLRFTVGTDPIVDLRLMPFDAIASAAHAKMLSNIEILNSSEVAKLLLELESIYHRSVKGEISIPLELEDCHSTIEAILTDKLGDLGKKIHTGRSRNDQVLVASRLFLRDKLAEGLSAAAELARLFLKRAGEGQMPIPGYTHLQPAMPSSAGMWFHSYGEALLDCVQAGLDLAGRLNKNPLGAASGFDVPLALDRHLTAKLLGFSGIHRSVIDAQNSRGRYEKEVLQWYSNVGGVLEKYASDCILYLTKEFDLLILPAEFTTGSSIMPQKKNPDLFELIRARTSSVRSAAHEVEGITAKLPGSFHRDFQAIKEPTIRGVDLGLELLRVAQLSLGSIQFNQESAQAKMYPELYATYEAYRLVSAGVPFREAYKLAGDTSKNGRLDTEGLRDLFAQITARSDSGIALASQDLDLLQTEIDKLKQLNSTVQETIFDLDR